MRLLGIDEAGLNFAMIYDLHDGVVVRSTDGSVDGDTDEQSQTRINQAKIAVEISVVPAGWCVEGRRQLAPQECQGARMKTIVYGCHKIEIPGVGLTGKEQVSV